MNGREKEYCYQTEKERESVVVEEKKMISSSKSVQGFPAAPHETLSPPSEPPTSHCLFTYTHSLPFRTIYMQSIQWFVAVLCKCVCLVDLFSRRKTLLLELKSVGAIN